MKRDVNMLRRQNYHIHSMLCLMNVYLCGKTMLLATRQAMEVRDAQPTALPHSLVRPDHQIKAFRSFGVAVQLSSWHLRGMVPGGCKDKEEQTSQRHQIRASTSRCGKLASARVWRACKRRTLVDCAIALSLPTKAATYRGVKGPSRRLHHCQCQP